MVEDSADDFQKVQDLCHSKVMCSTLARLSSGEASKFHSIPA